MNKKDRIIGKIKTYTIIILILMLPCAYFCGRLSASTLSIGDSLVADWKNRFEQLKISTDSTISSLQATLDEKMAILATQTELIKEYEAKEEVNTMVTEIRDINVELFKECSTSIDIEETEPFRIAGTNQMLTPEIFGNLYERDEKLKVTYYFGVFPAKINVKNIANEKVEITYTANSFMDPPYRINSRQVNLNWTGKLLTSYENDDLDVIIDTKGRELLTEVENQYIERLKTDYADSKIPVYVNGILLQDWNESNKIIK